MIDTATDAFKDLTGIAPVLTLSLLLNIVLCMFIKWLIKSDKEKTMHTKETDDARIEFLTNKILDIVDKR